MLRAPSPFAPTPPVLRPQPLPIPVVAPAKPDETTEPANGPTPPKVALLSAVS